MPEPVLRIIDRTLAILRCWDESSPEEGFTLSDLTKKTGFHKTVVYRLLATLSAYEIVRKDPRTGRYQLGPTLIELGSLAASKMGFRRLAVPIMENLAARRKETVELTIISGLEVVCVEKVDSPSRIKVSYEVGRRRPIYTGAAAKVLLAFTPEPDRSRLIDSVELVRFTPLTITDREALRAELAQIRERGYATSFGEIDEGVTGIGAPVWDGDGRLVCGLTLVGPGTRLNHIIPDCARDVMDAAKELSHLLGAKMSDHSAGFHC